MLQIKDRNNIIFEGKNVMQEIPVNSFGDFLLSCVSETVTLGNNLTLADMMELLAPIKDFVKSYFLEEHQALQAIVLSDYVSQPISHLIVYKEMIVSPDGEIMTCVKVRGENKAQIGSYSDVLVSFDPVLKIVDESQTLSLEQNYTTSLGFLELLEAIYTEFQDYITLSTS